MPYSNIVFVKLFLSLFEEDDRFLYQLNESQQLLYIKMLYMAGTTKNNISKNISFIKNKINYHHEEQCFLSDIERIKIVFPKFKEIDGFYHFENFEELHNYIGKSKGNPKEIQRSSKGSYQNKNKKKNKNKSVAPTLTDDEFIKTLKDNPAYKHIDISTELAKMDSWLLANPRRQKTRKFIVGWINRIEKPLETVKQISRGEVR